MPILPESAYKIPYPEMVKVKQIFPDEKINDIHCVIEQEISKEEIRSKIKSGSKIGVLVGSRGIVSISQIVKSVVSCIKKYGGEPFIIPAMGSHGGGIAEEQKNILEELGVTEAFVNAPILASMDTVILSYTKDGIPIYIDKIASRADMIVPVARVKAHTDFEGSIESGLCKMLAIGMGKHTGCARLHQAGFSRFSELIPEVAKCIIKKAPIGFGIALIENAHEHLHKIQAVLGTKFLEEEPKLLELSKSLMPKLNFKDIDVLIVEQIGKDITGGGIDPNITGRISSGRIPGFRGLEIKRIVVLNLSKGTHHNATGIGIADFITKNVFDEMDYVSTYANCIASGTPEAGRIPIMMDTEQEAVLAAIQTCGNIDAANAKVVKIKDSLHLIDIEVSKNLLEYCRRSKHFFVI